MTPAAEVARRIALYRRRFARRRAIEAAAWSLPRALFPLIHPLARRRGADNRILAVERILRIGDTLVTRPALAALRARFPDAEVAVVCQPALAPLCRADGLIDLTVEAGPGPAGWRAAAAEARAFGAGRAFVFVPDRWSPYLAWLAGAREITGYDYGRRGAALTVRRTAPARANVPCFLYADDAPPIHASEIWLRLVDADAAVPERYPPFDPGDEARAAATRFLAANRLTGRSPLVIVHAGAANPSYLWRPDLWLETARLLRGAGVSAIVLTGGHEERAAAEALAREIGGEVAVAAGETTLLETMALVAAADLVISLDTAAVHIAATMGTPVVGLYGPGDGAMWRPLGVPGRVIPGESPCRGCKAARCFQDRHYCMEAIAPAAVAAAALDLLAGGKA